jgi:hypothetical protein
MNRSGATESVSKDCCASRLGEERRRSRYISRRPRETGLAVETADPSVSLGMTKGRTALPSKFDSVDDEQQVPPLRFASVGMTLLERVEVFSSPSVGCRPVIPPPVAMTDFSRPLRDWSSFVTTTQDYALGYFQTSLRDFADAECALLHWIDLGRLIESPVGGAKAIVGASPLIFGPRTLRRSRGTRRFPVSCL